MPNAKDQAADIARLFKVADCFLRAKMTAQEIAAELEISRQAVYPMLAEARDKGLIVLNPPIAEERSKQITKKFDCKPGSITVVGVTDQHMGEQVAFVAAEKVLGLIEELGTGGCAEVGLGLGPGRATLDFSRRLSQMLLTNTKLPKLNLFAISAGAPANKPEYASSSFFNLYPRDAINECFGLFAENLIKCSGFAEILQNPGVVEGFSRKDQINIIVTAMGDIEDKHDLLGEFMTQSKVVLESLKDRGWVGNVQYRPFTNSSPAEELDGDYRAVTLFELKEFVEIAKTKDRHVVLIARRCGTCGRTRAKALRPLLQVKSLKVWSHIVMDLSTANELLATR